jgi:hypothetical protein
MTLTPFAYYVLGCLFGASVMFIACAGPVLVLRKALRLAVRSLVDANRKLALSNDPRVQFFVSADRVESHMNVSTVKVPFLARGSQN